MSEHISCIKWSWVTEGADYSVNRAAPLPFLFRPEKLILSVIGSVPCLWLTIESLSRNYAWPKGSTHSRLCHLLVLVLAQNLSSQCVCMKVLPHCFNFGHLWKAILASEIPLESTEAFVETVSQLNFSLCSILLPPFPKIFRESTPINLLHTNHHLKAYFLGKWNYETDR